MGKVTLDRSFPERHMQGVVTLADITRNIIQPSGARTQQTAQWLGKNPELSQRGNGRDEYPLYPVTFAQVVQEPHLLAAEPAWARAAQHVIHPECQHGHIKRSNIPQFQHVPRFCCRRSRPGDKMPRDARLRSKMEQHLACQRLILPLYPHACGRRIAKDKQAQWRPCSHRPAAWPFGFRKLAPQGDHPQLQDTDRDRGVIAQRECHPASMTRAPLLVISGAGP